MVKGISKQVIVVKGPANSMFDQAIFILKEDALASSVNSENILREACSVADEYVKTHCKASAFRTRRRVPALIFGIVIALAIIIPVALSIF